MPLPQGLFTLDAVYHSAPGLNPTAHHYISNDRVVWPSQKDTLTFKTRFLLFGLQFM